MTTRKKTRAGTAGGGKRGDRSAIAPVPTRTRVAWSEADSGPADLTDPVDLVDHHALDVLDLSDRFELSSPVGRAESMSEAINDDQLVEEHDAPSALGVAIFEVAAQLSAVQAAVAAAGHRVIRAATGRGGVEALHDLLVARDRGGVDVLIVQLPGGELLVDAARGLHAPPIVIASCAGLAGDAIERAVAGGADLVALRSHDGERLAPILFAAGRLIEARRASRSPTEEKRPAQVARDRLDEQRATGGRIIPFQEFQAELETELRRARRFAYPIAVALLAVDVPPHAAAPAIRTQLKARAGQTIVDRMRDIDLATELDHERFLVLLPYTDLTVAGEVARRIIAAVAAQDPVELGGRAYPVRVIGAISSARSDQPLSFARLMKDATRGLEDARRDGADFAVVP